MKKLLENKSIGFYALLAACLLSLVAGIICLVANFENGVLAFIMCLLSAISAGLCAFKPFKFVEFLPFLFAVVPFGLVLNELLVNIAELWFKNISSINDALIPLLVFNVLAIIASCIAVFARVEKKAE